MVLLSLKEDKCSSLRTWKGKKSTYRSTLAVLTTSVLPVIKHLFHFVSTQKAPTLLPTVENPKSHWFVSSMSAFETSGAWIGTFYHKCGLFFCWSKDSCTKMAICNHGIEVGYRNKCHHVERAMMSWQYPLCELSHFLRVLPLSLHFNGQFFPEIISFLCYSAKCYHY